MSKNTSTPLDLSYYALFYLFIYFECTQVKKHDYYVLMQAKICARDRIDLCGCCQISSSIKKCAFIILVGIQARSPSSLGMVNGLAGQFWPY